MIYSHKKNLALIRGLYVFLILAGLIASFIKVEVPYINSIVSLLALASVIVGIFICIRFDMTTYACVISARETDFDFYIEKKTGKRGYYICYFYLSDAVKIVKYDAESKEQLKAEFGDSLFFHNYTHCMTSNDKYAILFHLEGRYDALICDLGPEFISYFNECKELAVAVPRDDDDDDEYGQPMYTLEKNENENEAEELAENLSVNEESNNADISSEITDNASYNVSANEESDNADSSIEAADNTSYDEAEKIPTSEDNN